MRIYDCFIYNGEIEVLNIRLEELYNTVDLFVIIEATKTFSGKPKQPLFESQLHLIQKFVSKIRYIIVEDNTEQSGAWEREFFQKNSITRGLFDAKEEDLIIFSDTDEIPKAETIKSIINSTEKWNAIKQKFFYFYLNYQNIYGSEANTAWSCTFPAIALKKYTPVELREGIRSGNIKARFIENGGWHFSYLSDTPGVIKKIQDFSHQEHNTKEILSKTNIDEIIAKRQDMFSRRKFLWDIVGTNDLPRFIKENPQQYSKFILTSKGKASIIASLKVRAIKALFTFLDVFKIKKP